MKLVDESETLKIFLNDELFSKTKCKEPSNIPQLVI